MLIRELRYGFPIFCNIARAPDGDDGAGGGTPPPTGDKPPTGEPAPASPPAGDGTPPATPATPAPSDSAAPQGTPPADGKPADGKPADATPAPVDWSKRREGLISSVAEEHREKVGKVLGKYATEDAMILALAAADSKISELGEKAKDAIKLPVKDAKPEDIAAFDKAWGVPDTADKYEIKRSDDFVPTELDKLADAKIKETAKKLHANQEQLDGMLALVAEIKTMENQDLVKRAEQSATKAEDELRLAWGVNEYKPTVASIQRYVDEVVKPVVGGDAETSFLDRRFADGTCLGEDPKFLKFFFQSVVKPYMDDNGIPIGNTAPGDASQDSIRLTEIKSMMHSDDPEKRKLYQTEGIQKELDQLLQRQMQRGKQKVA